MSFYLKSVQYVSVVRRGAGLLLFGLCLSSAGSLSAQDHTPTNNKPRDSAEKKADSDGQEPAPEEPHGPSCRLLTEEAPRGGQLELRAERIGRTPLVLVNGEVVRILSRKHALISAQIPRDSNGGMVTLKVEGQQLPCGTLSIIGKD